MQDGSLRSGLDRRVTVVDFPVMTARKTTSAGRSSRAERRSREARDRGQKRVQKRRPAESTLRFSSSNAIFAGVGLITVILGYYLLAQGSITLAPLLLVLGYVVLLPLAIIR